MDETATTRPSGFAMPDARRLLAVVAVGVAIGVVTQLLQGILPGALNWIANSLSGWLVAAFIVGSRMPSPRWAALTGPPLLIAALAGYYATTTLRYGMGAGGLTFVFWSLGAIAGGAVFGAAGWWWRNGRQRTRAAAAGLLGALLIAEGVYFLAAILPDPAVGYGAIVAGLAAPLILGRTWRERGLGELALVPGLLLGAAGFAVTLAIYGMLTGVSV